MLFFINSPKIKKKKIINGNYQAVDIYSIIKKFTIDNVDLNNFLIFTKNKK